MDCAVHGIPAETVSMPLAGATSPVTLAGALVQHTAESLSGVVIHQTVSPGAPIVYGGAPAIFDMRKGTTPLAAVESSMIEMAYAQIGKSFGLPVHGYLALSDAKLPDYQAGFETAMGATHRRALAYQRRFRPRHARFLELPEPREGGSRRRGLPDGEAAHRRDEIPPGETTASTFFAR